MALLETKKLIVIFLNSIIVEVEEDLGVRCPCLDPADDGTMILCSICNYWQHAICFCLYDEANMPETHVCHLCSDKVRCNTACVKLSLDFLVITYLIFMSHSRLGVSTFIRTTFSLFKEIALEIGFIE